MLVNSAFIGEGSLQCWASISSFSLPIGDDGSQMNVHDALTKMFEARAVPGKEGFVQGSAVEWPWANLLAADYVWVIGGDDASPTSECVV